MNTLKPDSTLQGGKYRIVRELGQGSFGITYLATTQTTVDGSLGKLRVDVNVTIKEFFMTDLNNRSTDGSSVENTCNSIVTGYRRKFRREAENLSKMHHPNIVKVVEVFDENNTTYYVMEYIDGETLDEYILRHGSIREKPSLMIFRKLCEALQYMHGHHMLHLDLKPKNVMVARSSEKVLKLYLIDFGLSKQFTGKGEPESSTSIGLGTPGYAPIEQATYKQDGSFPATLDTYALGATLFKMLTGQRPPDASEVINDGLPVTPLKEKGISEATIAFVQKAMQPIRKYRFQSVSELINAIPATDGQGAGVKADFGGEDTEFSDGKTTSDRKEEPTQRVKSSKKTKMYTTLVLSLGIILTFVSKCYIKISDIGSEDYTDVVDTLYEEVEATDYEQMYLDSVAVADSVAVDYKDGESVVCE